MNAQFLRKGDVIVHCDDAYPEGALIVDGFDVQRNLQAHPLGGGMRLTIHGVAISRFAKPGAFESTPVYRSAIFGIEDVREQFRGWTDGRLWNGWAMPYFEFDTAVRVTTNLDSSSGRYDPATDSFVTVTTDGENEHWPGTTLALPDGGFVKAYPVGAGSWIWDEEEETP